MSNLILGIARRPSCAVTIWSLVLAVAFVWVPGYWLDEAATVLMADKSWDSFIATIRHVDAVHAMYYLLMRGWSHVFGLGTLSTRLASAAAVAATSLVLVNLGRTTHSLRVGVVAGIPSSQRQSGLLERRGRTRFAPLSHHRPCSSCKHRQLLTKTVP